MKTNDFQKELSLSLLADDELRDSIDNLEILLGVKLNFNKIQMLRKYILDEDPKRIFSQYSDFLLDTINSVEMALPASNRRIGSSIVKYIQNNDFKSLLENLTFTDSYGQAVSIPGWEEEIHVIDNDIFQNYINSTNQSLLKMKNLNGRIVDAKDINSNGFYRKEKPFNERMDISFLYPSRNFNYYNASNSIDDVLKQSKEIQYSKSFNLVTGQRAFIFLNLLQMKDISIFNTMTNALKAISAQIKETTFDFTKLKEINESINSDLKNLFFVYNIGVSISTPENKEKNDVYDMILNGSDNLHFYSIVDPTRKWISTNAPMEIHQTSTFFYNDAKKVSDYKMEAGKIIREIRKFMSGNKVGDGRLNINNYSYFKTTLDSIEKTLKQNSSNFPLLPINNKEKNNSFGRVGTGGALSTVLYISKLLNLEQEVESMYKVFSLECSENYTERSSVFEYFISNSENQNNF